MNSKRSTTTAVAVAAAARRLFSSFICHYAISIEIVSEKFWILQK